MTKRVRVVVGMVAVLAGAAGCTGGGPKRYAVSGAVKVKGSPIKYGNVRFWPDFPGGADGGAIIKDGRYDVEAARGLMAGKYKVILSAPDRVPEVDPKAAPGNDLAGPPIKELFPTNYTRQDKTPLTIDVTPDGPNVFDFDAK
jgi:hypothetical protein